MNKRIGTKEFYEQYALDTFKKKEGRERAKINRDSPYYIEKAQFTAILKDLMSEIKSLMIKKSFSWSIPKYLGNLIIYKRYRNMGYEKDGKFVNILPIDFKKTKELRKKGIDKTAYNFNQHSEGFVMTITYDKKSAKYPYKQLIRFKAAKHFRRELAKELKTNPSIDFYEKC